ncbi:hypothetical protein VCHC28A1_3433, partial [Vibrio cholerae HC-28A1]
MEGWASETH